MDLRELPKEWMPRHPWELARCRFFHDVLRKASREPAKRILDVGAGDAWLSQLLLERSPPVQGLTCWDQHYTPELVCKLQATADARVEFCIEQPSGRYDTMLLLDILEHVEDDQGFLRRLIEQNLRPGGLVLASVPAWQLLYSRHDRALLHHRRYAPSQFRALLGTAGLTILRSGGLFHALLLPRLISVALHRLLGERSDDAVPDPLSWDKPRVVTWFVNGALAADNFLSKLAARARINLPGLSVWALCQKPF